MNLQHVTESFRAAVVTVALRYRGDSSIGLVDAFVKAVEAERARWLTKFSEKDVAAVDAVNDIADRAVARAKRDGRVTIAEFAE